MTQIWFNRPNIGDMTTQGRETMVQHLGIELLEVGDDYVKGRMPVDARTRQPHGVLHGGASVAFAETLASWSAMHCVDPDRNSIVGLEINANHVRTVRQGWVYGVARPLHRGRTTHVWEIRITDDADRLVCASRITIAVLAAAGGNRREDGSDAAKP